MHVKASFTAAISLMAGFCLLGFAQTAAANVVWPALYLETRLFSWWAISLGLAVEYLFVRQLFQTTPWRALKTTVAANTVSALAGVLLIPLAGILWELGPGLLLYTLAGYGTFNPATWLGSFLLACAVNTALEGYVYRYFKLPFRFKSRLFALFMLANAISVGAALGSLILIPLRM